ncbi:hypothetical protein FQR65_LT19208 [Abscondita terminalis]|nr:hypothetical protein FQR65_LT19208 [Abscondita terminalis]
MLSRKVPQKIHFIWLGSPVPQKYLSSILKLLSVAERSDFIINLWVDKESNYWKAIQKATPLDLINSQKSANLSIRNINELSNHREIFNELKDEQAKEEYEIHDNDKKLFDLIELYVARETVGLKNYAAASDLLRYAILYVEGGYYFDTDTEFQSLSCKSKLSADHLDLGIRVGLSEYFGKVDGDRLSDLRGFAGGNDVLAALPKHPVFKDALLYSTSKYLERDKYKKMGQKFLNYDDRLKFTQNYTGPYLLYACIRSFWDSCEDSSLSAFESMLTSKERSDFIINLWVDKESNYWKAIQKATPLDLINSQKSANLSIRNINELSNHREIFNELKDEQAKEEYEIHDNDKKLFDLIELYVARETVGLKNYAAASDLLRYAILYVEGGYYFDTDTEFQSLSCKSKLSADHLDLGIRVGLSEYFGKVDGDRLSDLRGFAGGNDVLAALPKHPVFKDALLYSTSKYLERDKYKKMGQKFLNYDDRLKFTQNYTGPYLLYACIRSFWDSCEDSSLSAFESMLTSKGTREGRRIMSSKEYIFDFAGIKVKSESDETWLAPLKKKSFDDNGLSNKLSFNFFNLDENKIEKKDTSLEEKHEKTSIYFNNIIIKN